MIFNDLLEEMASNVSCQMLLMDRYYCYTCHKLRTLSTTTSSGAREDGRKKRRLAAATTTVASLAPSPPHFAFCSCCIHVILAKDTHRVLNAHLPRSSPLEVIVIIVPSPPAATARRTFLVRLR